MRTLQCLENYVIFASRLFLGGEEKISKTHVFSISNIGCLPKEEEETIAGGLPTEVEMGCLACAARNRNNDRLIIVFVKM